MIQTTGICDISNKSYHYLYQLFKNGATWVSSLFSRNVDKIFTLQFACSTFLSSIHGAFGNRILKTRVGKKKTTENGTEAIVKRKFYALSFASSKGSRDKEIYVWVYWEGKRVDSFSCGFIHIQKIHCAISNSHCAYILIIFFLYTSLKSIATIQRDFFPLLLFPIVECITVPKQELMKEIKRKTHPSEGSFICFYLIFNKE